MIANHTPSLITSTAAAVAVRAWVIFRPAIEKEQSTMMISALPPGAPGSGSAVSAETSAVTVTIALTSRPPEGRYAFWSMSTVKPGRLVMAAQSAYFAVGGAGTGVPTQRA
jgi:hypothetical protein